jgi:hypothetical protein
MHKHQHHQQSSEIRSPKAGQRACRQTLIAAKDGVMIGATCVASIPFAVDVLVHSQCPFSGKLSMQHWRVGGLHNPWRAPRAALLRTLPLQTFVNTLAARVQTSVIGTAVFLHVEGPLAARHNMCV